VSFFAYAPGPDLASTAPVVRMCLKNNKTIIQYSIKFAPPDPVPVSGRGGQALNIT